MKPTANSVVIAAKSTQPCRWSFTKRPNVYVSAPPIRKIRNSSNASLSPVGFSNGEAEFALTNPPPLVPSSLITSIDAIGPCGIDCAAPSTVLAVV